MKIHLLHHIRSILFVIVLLGCFLRFYQVGENPPGLNWDEASLGYNAYSLLKTGADEYGTPFPLSIRSFDDYKPPLYVYLTIPSIALFGLHAFSVRFVSALLGSLAVLVMYGLAKEFLYERKYAGRTYQVLYQYAPLLAAFFLAISPWHLQFSRAAYEGNSGLFFFMLGTYLLLRAYRTGSGFIWSGVFFGLTLYAYHSFRLVTPVFLIVVSLIFFRRALKNRTGYLMMMGILCVAVIPVIISFFSAAGTGSRLSMVTIFTGHDVLASSIERIQYDQEQGYPFSELVHNRRIVYVLSAAKAYLDHFDPRYLFIFGDGGKHHHAADFGMLYLVDVVFLAVGSIVATTQMTKRRLALFALLFIAPIAAAITTGTPHPVRAIAMVPVFHILTAIGIIFIVYKSMSFKRAYWYSIVTTCIVLAYAGNIMYYFHQYYVHTPIEYGYFWQAGHRELFTKIKSVEEQYDSIIVTYYYDQPYIFYLFYNGIDPVWYQKNWDTNGTGQTDRMYRKIGKYEFRPIDWNQDKLRPNTLIVGAPSEIPHDAPYIDTIEFPGGETAFVLVET